MKTKLVSGNIRIKSCLLESKEVVRFSFNMKLIYFQMITISLLIKPLHLFNLLHYVRHVSNRLLHQVPDDDEPEFSGVMQQNTTSILVIIRRRTMPTYSIMQRYIIEYKITYIQFFTANVQLLE